MPLAAHQAAAGGDAAELRCALAAHPAAVWDTDHLGRTPLQCAAYRGHLAATALLLHHAPGEALQPD